ncbi:hypothetical protein ADK67_14630 [Saccharothrix sp. NRRL B-16348]|nr:hypothetical protein ADK67_14630 [Saccharothrix sp. NRRL B-16348]
MLGDALDAHTGLFGEQGVDVVADVEAGQLVPRSAVVGRLGTVGTLYEACEEVLQVWRRSEVVIRRRPRPRR